jgi:hypothetical protein
MALPVWLLVYSDLYQLRRTHLFTHWPAATRIVNAAGQLVAHITDSICISIQLLIIAGVGAVIVSINDTVVIQIALTLQLTCRFSTYSTTARCRVANITDSVPVSIKLQGVTRIRAVVG